MIRHKSDNWKPDSFQLISEDEAGWLILAVLCVCLLIDLYGRNA